MNIDYDALVDTTSIEDITSCDYQRELLYEIKNNDHNCTFISLSDNGDIYDYLPENLRDLGWLGYFIGKNTSLRGLSIDAIDLLNSPGAIEIFCTGVNQNRFIEKITFFCLGEAEMRGVLQSMNTFFKCNHLTDIDLIACGMDAEACRQFCLSVGGRKSIKSLKQVNIEDCEIEDRSMVDIILSLSSHSQLKVLYLQSNVGFGRNSCIALESLVHWTTTNLQNLNLSYNQIGDESMKMIARGLSNSKALRTLQLSGNDFGDNGVEALVAVLKSSTKLEKLYISQNHSITIKGYKAIAILLGIPTLKELYAANDNTGDEVAEIFANALVNNRTLKKLYIFTYYSSLISAAGWEAFTRLLCDTSSVNNTFTSNHSLLYLAGPLALQPGTRALLELNKNANKEHVAMIKILENHTEFDIQPLLKWDLKVLPDLIGWFERGSALNALYVHLDVNIGKLELATLFDYIRAMPMLAIDGLTRFELNNIRSEEAILMRNTDAFETLASQVQALELRRIHAMKRLLHPHSSSLGRLNFVECE